MTYKCEGCNQGRNCDCPPMIAPMNTTYHYVVLRLAVDKMRGEVLNVGIALLAGSEPARIVMMATLNKLRAVDASWSAQRMAAWTANARAVLESSKTAAEQVQALHRFGLCEPDAVGMFTASTPDEVTEQLARIRVSYVSNRSPEDKPKREKRTRLQTALGWYCVSNHGMATLCVDGDDARQVAKDANSQWPRHGPHKAMQLCEYQEAAPADQLPDAGKMAAALRAIADGTVTGGQSQSHLATVLAYQVLARKTLETDAEQKRMARLAHLEHKLDQDSNTTDERNRT